MDTRSSCRSGGFTLIELLVVLIIITLLATLGLTMLRGAREDALEFECSGFIQAVSATLELYRGQRNIGVYPPTTLEGFSGVGKTSDRLNQGIETLIVCLNSPGFKGDRVLENFRTEDNFVNFDRDSSAKPLSIYASNELFEFLDPWGTPYAYFNAADYNDAKVRQYTVAPGGGGDPQTVTVKPWTDSKTKSFFNLDSYQFFSAGADREYNTEDDIGNWGR